MGWANTNKTVASPNPQIDPILKAVREIICDDDAATVLLLLLLVAATDLAIKLVAPIDRKSSGSGALSLMLLAGPKAANSNELDRPIKAASIKLINGGQR